jgi:hypothetical protein
VVTGTLNGYLILSTGVDKETLGKSKNKKKNFDFNCTFVLDKKLVLG